MGYHSKYGDNLYNLIYYIQQFDSNYKIDSLLKNTFLTIKIVILRRLLSHEKIKNKKISHYNFLCGNIFHNKQDDSLEKLLSLRLKSIAENMQHNCLKICGNILM